MMEELELYCKKLRLGREILEDFEDIEFINNKDFLTQILKKSYQNLEIRRKNCRIRDAKFEILKTFENFDSKELDLPETLNLHKLKTCSFIEKNENLIFYGGSGRGQRAYLSAIKDGSINEILAYEVPDNLKLELATNTIEKLCRKRFMDYYNNHRYQWDLKKMTPVEYRNHLLNA
jgi:hypothetical protein